MAFLALLIMMMVRVERMPSVLFLFLLFSVQLALSSDKLSSLNTPLLNLCLDLTENGIQRGVNIEMNKEELNTLITALEAANKVLSCSHIYNFS